ncbi:hypothetical protein NPX13_g4721 [Xylaria arbuscula]|uniref:Aminoglycoside phosphotransferase domain-containing protein n=1 Tax=Xylaria arbuscula TaxID=114810 RepID=A0A9W8NFY2_9PEZI|nr:hypothetical protein NPX13_g4721 [Xylaria arbuscula]
MCERSQSPCSDTASDSASDTTVAPSNFISTNSSFSQPDDHDAQPDSGEVIGSDLWDSPEDDDPDSEIRKAARKFFDAIDWQALASIASSHRGGMHCSYADGSKFSCGQFNMVRRLDFTDGVRWVARVRLSNEATPAPLARYDSRRAFEIEVASMKFLKSKSKIPVPEVFAYSHECSNQIGAPYMLIEYIKGTTAADLSFLQGSEPAMFGTPDQDQKFRQQMAKIQAQMLTFKFPKIGSLYYDEGTGSFYIGPDIETGKGPWISSSDYYRDLAEHLVTDALLNCPKFSTENNSFVAPTLLNHLMNIYCQGSSGPYTLTNRDFGPHNILVDNDFNIVGVIDFDGVFAAPTEVAAQYPTLSNMSLEPPGVEVTNPYSLQRIELEKPQLARYKEWLMEYEAQLNNGNTTISSLLGSRGAIVYAGFERCSQYSSYSSENWFTSALFMLKEYATNQRSE